MREVRASASASLGNKKSVAQRELIQKSRKMALVSPIKRQQMRRIQTREGRVCGTLVPPIIIKPHKTEKVKKYKGHDRGDAKRLSSKDRAARASQRLLVLKDLLKLKLLSSSQNRSLSRQDYHTFGTAFRKMDTNGDGVVDYDELAEALGPDGMNIGLREGEIFGLAREFDSDGNGTIDIEEFFHTLADLDAPDNHIPGILAECKKRELQNYTLKLVAIGEMMKRGKTVATRGEAVDAGVDVAPPGENANNGDGPPLDGDGPTTTLERPPPPSVISTNRSRRVRRKILQKTASLPSLSPPKMLGTSGFVTGEGHSSMSDLKHLEHTKTYRKKTEKKVWPTWKENSGRRRKRYQTMDFSQTDPEVLKTLKQSFSGRWTGKRMYRGKEDFNSHFKIEAPGAPSTMDSWKRTSTPSWTKHVESKRKGAEVFIPILAKRYAKRDEVAFRKYNCRISGRVKSRYNYMVGFFENEMALERTQQRGNRKGMLMSNISVKQRQGQGW
jgi:hypothetical protein